MHHSGYPEGAYVIYVRTEIEVKDDVWNSALYRFYLDLFSLFLKPLFFELFLFFAIFFFFSLYPDMNKRYRYFKGYESGEKSTEEVEVLIKTGDMCRINGLYAYPIRVRSFDGLNNVDKVIYVFDNSLDIEQNDRLTVTTYQRIIIEAESHL